MTARLDVMLRFAWHPHVTGRPPLSWPCVLVHPETCAAIAPPPSTTEARRLAREVRRQRAEAFDALYRVWRIGQPPRWTGPRRVVTCQDEAQEAVA